MSTFGTQIFPPTYQEILRRSEDMGFTMPSDMKVGFLLRTLAASKPDGKFLELGTGTGLSLSWIVDGMNEGCTVISIDNDNIYLQIAEYYFESDSRVTLCCEDAAKWLNTYKGTGFDLVFADAWPGKYSLLDTTLGLIKPGGFYIIDDMIPQSNWPKGHELEVERLRTELDARQDFSKTELNWASGIVIMVKK